MVTVITIAYSATQVNVAFGEQTMTTTQQTITISLPVNIHNAGLYDITQLNLTTSITGEDSQTLARGVTYTPIIPRGTDETETHTVVIDINQILADHSSLLFNDTDFTVFQYASFKFANAIPLSVHANYTMQWGAPLSNLAIGNPTYSSYNTTHSIITVQLYFENHNQYLPVTGVAHIEIYNTRQTLKGAGTANIDAQPNTLYSMQVDVMVTNFRQIPPSGEIHVFFETAAFNYGPVVIPLG
jgi:hypothetical protein